MPGCAFRSEGAASAPGGGGRARVGGGEGGGPLAGAGAGGSAAPRPRPAPPRRHFAGGCRGDQSRLSGGGGQCGTQARRQNGNPASCSQVRAGPPRPPHPARGAALTGPGREVPAAPTRPAWHGPRALSSAPLSGLRPLRRPFAAGRVDVSRPPVPAESARAPRRSPLRGFGASVRSGPQAAPRGVK